MSPRINCETLNIQQYYFFRLLRLSIEKVITMTRRVTLREVADQAGVSITTVSNVIRGWPHISNETRRKVEHAIEALGYVPHPIAQGLRTGRTFVIGFVVPDISNPHFASMVSTIEEIAREHNYNILLFNTNDDEAVEADCIHQSIKRWVDGLFIVQAAHARTTSETLASVNVPVVAMDRVPGDFEGISCRIDNLHASRQALNHLCKLGHTRIAHLAGPQGALPAADRLIGYHQTLQEHNLSYERVMVSDGTWGSEAGYDAMKQILKDDVRPTAIFASNDVMAIGALHALFEQKLRVPEDISLVGVDDISISKHLTPPLTTVKQPLEQMARAGIDKLLKLMNDESVVSISETFLPELVVRESTSVPIA